MPSKDKYTDPKLRDEIKEEIHNSDKGGAPGQWSARKAQMMASEYKKRGGDYTTDKSEKDESQKHLDQWGEEDWQTKDGSGNAKQEDGTQQRYLPKKAWENMTEEEKEKTDQKKQEGSKNGKQYVANTDKAKDSRKNAQKNDEEGENEENEEEDEEKENDEKQSKKQDNKSQKKQDSGKKSAKESKAKTKKTDQKNEGDEDDEEYVDEDEEQQDDEDQDDNSNSRKRKDSPQQTEKDAPSPKKQKSSNSSSSKKTVGSKHMPAEEPAARGSADRLPSKGDKVTWKAMPGYVDGEVVEIVTSNKNVDGKSVKASKDDPKIVLKSEKSGKICVHKPDACFYD